MCKNFNLKFCTVACISLAILFGFMHHDALARTKVQKGISPVISGDTYTVQIETVDTSKSIILFLYRTESCDYAQVYPSTQSWAGEFTDSGGTAISPYGIQADYITFRRAYGDTNHEAVISWYVIESDAFEVEFVKDSFGSTDTDRYINLSNDYGDSAGKAFAVVRSTNCTHSLSDWGERMNAIYFTAEIEYNYSGSSDRLRVRRYRGEAGDLSADVWAFVVKLHDDSLVYQGESYMDINSFLAISTLPQAVDRTNSIMLFSTRLNESALGAELRGAITSDTQVGFNRRYSGSNVDEGYAYWYVIEFGTLGNAESGETMLPINDTTPVPHQLGNPVHEFLSFSTSTQDCTGTGHAFYRIRHSDTTASCTTADCSGGGEPNYDCANDSCTHLIFQRIEAGQQAVNDFFMAELEPMRLFTPNGGEVWVAGNQYDITWYAPDQITNVELLLSNDGGDDGGDTWPITISSSTANNGLFQWTIPNDAGIIGNQMEVKVRDVNWDQYGRTDDYYSSDTSDADFEIICQIDLTYPVGTEEITYDDPTDITWIFYGDPTARTVAIKYSDNGGSSYDNTIATGVAANSSPYTLDWGSTPFPLSSFLKVKVEQETEESRVYDNSTENFTVKGEIVVTAPNGTEQWDIGTSHAITWTAKGAADMPSGVNIFISRNNGGSWTSIASGESAAGGSYTWDPVTAPDSTECLVRVQSVDYPLVKDESDAVFEIKKVLDMTEPNVAGETWRLGEYHWIRWNTLGTVTNVDIHYDAQQGGGWKVVVLGEPNGGEYEWYLDPNAGTPIELSENVKFRVRDNATPAIYDESDVTIRIKGDLDITYPNGGETFTVNGSENITWTAKGNLGNCTLTLDRYGNQSEEYTLVSNVAAGDQTWNWSPIPDYTTTTGKIRISLNSDPAGVVDSSDAGFNIKGALTLTAPNGDVTSFDVGDNTNITWTYVGSVGNVQLRYSTDDGSTYPPAKIIGTYAQDASPVPWTIPDDISNTVRVKVEKATDNTVFDESDNNFDIKGSLTLTAPNGGQTWYVDDIQNITWTRDGSSMTTVRIDYSTNAGGSYPFNIATGVDSASLSYPWTVSDAIGQNVMVKITLESDSQTFDESDAVFIIKGQIDFTEPTDAPQTGVVWEVGTQQNIAWTSHGTMNSVNIKLSSDGGSTFPTTIASGLSNVDVMNNWTVIDAITTDNNVIRVEDAGDPTNVYGDSGLFSIKGRVVVTYPDGGEVFRVGSSENITWNAYGSIGNVIIELSTNGGTSYDTTIVGAPGVLATDESYTWTPIPDTIDNDLKIKITSLTYASVNDESDAVFQIKGVLDLTSPNGGGTYYVGDSENITWTKQGTLGNVTLEYSTDSGASYPGGPQVIANDVAAGSSPYPWTIPDEIGTHLRVKLSLNSDPTGVYDESAVDFEIKGKLVITSPNLGTEEWGVDTSEPITWTRFGSIANAELRYSTDSGNTYNNIIVGSTPAAAGSYPWTIPDAIGDQLRVKITDTSDGDVNDESDNDFSIKGRLVLSSPNGSEEWLVGSSHAITWNTYGTISTVNLYYSTDGGSTYGGTITTALANTDTYPWTVPDAIDNDIRVKVENNDDMAVSDESNANFTIRGTLTVTSPNGTEVWIVDSSHNITWTKEGSIGLVDIDLSTNSGASYDTSVAINVNSNDLSYPWSVPDIIDAQCRIKITAQSDPSNVVDESDADFEIRGALDLTAPNGGGTYYVNDSLNITWTKQGTLGNVTLEYSTDSGASYPGGPQVIATVAAGSSPYPWTIPDEIGDKLRVKISLDSDPTNVYDESLVDFEIKGKLTITVPNGGQTWGVGNTEGITWTVDGTIATAELRYSTDSGNTYPNIIIASTPAAAGSYPWDIPNDISTQVRVKITDTSDGDVNDESDNDFSIKGRLVLSSPNGSEEWLVGSSHAITWNTYGTISTVNLYYSTDGGSTYGGTITTALANTDTYPWTVPDAIDNDIRVKVENNDDMAVSDESNANFTIRGTLTVTSPNGTEVWIVDSSHNITWTKEGSIGLVDIDLSTNSGASYDTSVAINVNSNDLSYPWSVPDAIAATCRIKITAQSDPSNVVDESDNDFEIRGSVTVDAPNGGEAWSIGSGAVIDWTRHGTIGNIEILYSTNGGTSYDYTIVVSTDSSTGTYNWVTVSDTPSTQCKVKVTSLSDANVTDASDVNFSIRASVTLTAPNGTESWIVNSSHNITWTKTGSIPNAALDYSTNSGASYDNSIASVSGEALSQPWTIPDDISDTVRVRIRNLDDPNVVDESDADFSIKGSVTVVTPDGGEVYVVDSAYDVDWTYVGSIPNVKIEYSTDGGSSFPNVIINSTPAVTLSYNWTVGDTISDQCVVRVSDAADASVYDDSDAYFKIRGALTITSPNGGEPWNINDAENITWTMNGSVGNVKLEYSTDSGATYPNIIIASTPAAGLSYSWTIPDDPSTQCRVKITSVDDSTVVDTSNSDFDIKGNLDLTAPNGGEVWVVDSFENITWDKFGNIANVKLEYSDNSGLSYDYVIVPSVGAAALSYNWQIPDHISSTLRVKITDTGDADVTDESAADFEIKGSVTLSSPNGSEIWFVGESRNITWTKTGSIGNVKLEYSTDSGATYTNTIAPDVASGDLSYSWTVADAIGNQVKIKITANADAAVTDESDGDFTIKGVLLLTAPNGGEVWVVGDSRNITWNSTGSIANVKLEYSTDGGTSYPNLIIASTPCPVGSYSWTIPDAIDNDIRVKVSDALDASVNDVSDANFEIKASLTLTAPNGGEAWVVGTNENITWSKTGTISTVEIRYSINGGSSYDFIIAASVAGSDLSYSWNIPDDIGATVKVKVTSNDDPSVFDVSDSNFKIIGYLEVTAPNGAEEWVVGTTQSITWDLTGSIANVKLEYSTDSGATYPNLIIGSTPAAGLSYSWIIPNSVYKTIRVKVADASDVSVFDVSDADFTIMPSFDITAPDGGEVWDVASSRDITWTTTGDCSNVTLEYSTDSGVTYPNLIIASTPNTETYAWTVPDNLSISCKVRITDVDNPNAQDETAGLFKIRGALTLTAPNGFESWDVASVHQITWTMFGSIANVKLEYSTDSGATYPNLIIASTPAAPLSYDWTIPDDLSTNMRVKITDTADSTVLDESDGDFTVKGALTITSPNGGEDLVVGLSHNITWNRFGSIQNVKLEYSVNSGATYPNLIIAATDAGTGSYLWPIPDAIGTQVRVKATDVDNALVFDASDADFTIKGNMEVNTPNGGEVWFVGESQNITWTRTGSYPTVKIEYSTDSGATYPNMVAPSVDASSESYSWTVPDAIGSQLRVKVTDIANTTVTDGSNNDFTVKGVLDLTAPDGGEEWIVNSSHAITWLRTGSIPTVKLEYSTDSGATYPNIIVASTDASTGSYNWTVPDAIGSQLRVRISDTSDATVNDASAADFTVKGALTLTAPNGGEAWEIATVQNITWNRTGSISNVELRYSLDGGVTFPTVIAASADASTPYPWTIPDNPNTTVKVKVTQTSDSSVFDISDVNFKIVGSVTLTAPNGGEAWLYGGPQRKIEWTKTGSIANVKLEYSTNSGASYDYLIIAATPAGGLEYYWTIPDTPTTTARVRISDANDISVKDTSDADFSIQVQFDITQPNGGEVWIVNDTEDILWGTTGTASNVKLEYSTDGGASFPNVIEAATSNTGTYSWTIPDAISATVQVRVSDVNDPNSFDTSDVNFRIKGSLVLTAPNGGEAWIVDSSENITWTRNGSISTVKLEYSTDGGASYPNTITGSVGASLQTYAWTIPDAIDNDIRVKITDTSDATVSDTSNTDFSIKGALTVTVPNGGEAWTVASGQTITWTRNGSIVNIEIRYSTNSGATYPDVIVASTDASAGSYGWTIPDAISNTVRVKITDVTDATVNDASDADFTIQGALQLNSPNGGEIWYVGESRAITWTRTGSIPSVELRYSINSGVSFDAVIIASTDASTETYDWTVADAIGANARVKVTDTSNANVTDTSNADFSIKGVLLLNTPNGGETWRVGTVQNITWTPTGTINNVKLEYSTNGGSTYPFEITASTGGMSGSYGWTIPDALGQNVKVRVSDATDASVNDVSDGVFAIRGQLTVTSPNGAESWGVAEDHNITWIRNGSIANITIEYSTDGGATYPNTINANADAATGSHPWTIPDDISSQVKIRITDNADPSVSDVSDGNFKIVGILTLVSPDGGEAWDVNTNHNITWTLVGSIANVRLDYSTNSGATYPNNIIASAPAGALSFTWTVPDAVTTQSRVRVTDATDIAVGDTSDADFTIKAQFDITSPDGGEVWTVASSHDITWATTGTVSTVVLEYSTDGGSTYPFAITSPSTANTGSFPWTVPDAISSTVKVKVSDFNNANASAESDAPFKIRGNITVTAPNGAEAWIVGASENITWSLVGSISTVNIEYSVNGGASYPNAVASGVTASGGSYGWTIPDTLSQTCRVKVTDASDSTVYDTSDADFKIRGDLTLTSPNGTEAWIVDSFENVTWTMIGSIANVALEYSTNSGVSYPFTIVASFAAASGSYPWQIPDTITDLARVRVLDASDSSVYDASDADFSIKGALLLTAPNGTETWRVTDSENITWTVTGTISTVTLDYSTDSGASYPFNIVPSVSAAAGTYAWTIPDSISSQVRVRISNLSDAGVFDASDNDFDIVGQLIVGAPNGGEVWPVGTSQAVTWSPIGSIQNVKIELSTNGGVSYDSLITASTPASNMSYAWTIPDMITQTARVRVSDVADAGVFDTSDNNFKIRGNLTLNTPNGGEVWLINASENITWTRFGSIANAKLEYSTDGGTSYPNTIIGSIDASLETYGWVIPDNPGVQTKVKVSDAADPTVYDTSDGNFTIRGGFVLTVPNGAESWSVDSIRNITWSTFGSYANVRLEYSINNGVGWNFITGSAPNTGVYSWTVPDAISDQCKVKIAAVTDAQAVDESDAVFKIHGLLTVTSPDGGEEWGVNTSHDITWTRTGSIANVKLEYSTDGGATYPNLIADPVTGGLLSYAWTVPDAISNNVKVRITDSSDASVADESSNAFKIKSSFTLLAPNGGESWIVGSVENITWNTFGTVANAKLEYSTDSGVSFPNTIIASTPNTGTYPWTVPDAISSQCMVRVSDVTDSSAFDVSNANFKIKGDLTLTSPNGTETWAVGTSQLITWSRVGSIANVMLEYSDNNGTTFIPITASTLNTGSYSWIIPDAITTQALVRITDITDLTVTDTSDATFKIQGSFTLTSPNGGEAWLVGSSQNIIWSWNGTVPFVRLQYSTDSGATYPNDIVATTPNTGTYSWSVPDDVSPAVRVKVSDVTDDTAMDTSNSDFRIRCVFTLTSPNGGEEWKVGESRSITWNSVGTAPVVNLQYSRDDFVTDVQAVALGIGNTGSHTWTVPDAISNTVKVRVTDANDAGALDTSNADFRIIANITVTAPNGGQMWDVNTSHAITWTCQGTVSQVVIQYSTDGGASYPDTITATDNDGSYLWLVPDDITAEFRVKIYDQSDPTAYDTSDANAKIKAQFSLLTPNGGGGQELTVGEEYQITWTSVGTVTNVTLLYSTDDFASSNTIIASTPNDGSYDWKVPNDPSNTVKARVMSETDSDAYDSSDDTFSIVVGVLTLTSPSGGERWVVRETHDISWQTSQGTIPLVNLHYSKDNFVSDVNTIVTNLDNTVSPNSYSWQIPDDRSGTVRVRVSDIRDVTVNDISGAFTINYYTVNFEVRDLITNQPLSALVVDGTSNMGDVWQTNEDPQVPGAPLGSPCTVELPYGFWTIVWSKPEYGDKQISFDCSKDDPLAGTESEVIFMETTAVHIWRAYSDFSYDPSTDNLSVSSWLERDGFVVSGGIKADVYIYLEGTELAHLEAPGAEAVPVGNPQPDSAGFFHMLWENTGLESGKVYTTITIITNASGALFKTPDSFDITAEESIASMEDTVARVLDGPDSELSQALDSQAQLIEDKMDEQIDLIVGQDKTREEVIASGGMVGMVEQTLASFEDATEDAIDQLQAGADQAVTAGQELETTAKRYSWSATVAPNPALAGDLISIQCQGQPDKYPILNIYSWDNKPILSNYVMQEVSEGLYSVDVTADARFTVGKAYTYVITEQDTGGLVTGSGMVEEMSVTTIAGLAAAAPEAERAAKETLGLVEALEATIGSSDGVSISLTLQNLQEAVSELPEIIEREGAGSPEVTGVLNDITEKIDSIMSGEGFDFEELLGEKLADAPTIKEIRKKTNNIEGVLQILQRLFEAKFGGMDTPIVSTILQ